MVDYRIFWTEMVRFGPGRCKAYFLGPGFANYGLVGLFMASYATVNEEN